MSPCYSYDIFLTMTKNEVIELFNQMHPNHFKMDYITEMQTEENFDEQILNLSDFDVNSLEIPVPEGTTFGWYKGDGEKLFSAVNQVDESWSQFDIFKTGERVFCGFLNGELASFCVVEDMGTCNLGERKIKVGGPGCVGTVPAFRRKGIGLKMVQLATQILKEEGYEISWIHWTGVGKWYARLGYQTVFTWNKHGII